MTDTPLIERLNAAAKGLRTFYPSGAIELIPAGTMEEAATALTEAEAKLAKAREALELCLGALDAPEPNCSCHISPPCRDCTDYAGTREAIETASACLAELENG